MRLPDLDAILKSDLPCTERMVLLVIASHINNEGDTAWPSIDTIASMAGLHRSTTVRAVHDLKDKGWLTIKKRFSKSAVYGICHKSPCATSGNARLVAESVSSSRSALPPVVAESDSNHPREPSNEPIKKVRKIFVPPTVDEVDDYCVERNNSVDAEKFVDYYETRGWMLGKSKMVSWQAAVRTWEKNDAARAQTSPMSNPHPVGSEAYYDWEGARLQREGSNGG